MVHYPFVLLTEEGFPMPTTSDFSLGKVDVALTPRERFEEFLQARGKRITRQRRMIVEHVCARHEHFDALVGARAAADGQRLTERQEQRIRLDVGDEVEHVRRAVAHAARGPEAGHRTIRRPAAPDAPP